MSIRAAPVPRCPAPVPAIIRPARGSDLDALMALESASFEGDRLSRASMRRFLKSDAAVCLVAEAEGRPAGYVLITFRRGTAIARVYSIAVAESARGRGLGDRLMDSAETAAVARGAMAMRLEVRSDNAAAIALYEARGYRRFGEYLGYYEDHADALRLQKQIGPGLPAHETPVPYYRQTTEFTCGPAAMLMALASFGAVTRFDRVEEIELWREATTVYMTSGIGGCHPHGIAAALARRGLAVEIFLSAPGPFFLESVRSAEKREIMTLAHQGLEREAADLGVPVHHRGLDFETLAGVLDAGGLAIVLISAFRTYGERFPHWVLVHGRGPEHLYVHDPYVSDEEEEAAIQKADLPIPLAEFARMVRYGAARLEAAVIIRGRRDP